MTTDHLLMVIGMIALARWGAAALYDIVAWAIRKVSYTETRLGHWVWWKRNRYRMWRKAHGLHVD